MVLTIEQQEKLNKRLTDLRDYGGNERVAEVAGVTTRVIQKAQNGGNVRVVTMESIMGALLKVEGERREKLRNLNKALA